MWIAGLRTETEPDFAHEIHTLPLAGEIIKGLPCNSANYLQLHDCCGAFCDITVWRMATTALAHAINTHEDETFAQVLAVVTGSRD